MRARGEYDAFHNGGGRHWQPNANDQVLEPFIEVIDHISTVLMLSRAWLLQPQA